MRGADPSLLPDSDAFTVEDHLSVQHEIERRARAFWRARGCGPDGALGDWLRAEREVVTEFCLAYGRQFARPAVSRPGPKTGTSANPVTAAVPVEPMELAATRSRPASRRSRTRDAPPRPLVVNVSLRNPTKSTGGKP